MHCSLDPWAHEKTAVLVQVWIWAGALQDLKKDTLVGIAKAGARASANQASAENLFTTSGKSRQQFESAVVSRQQS